LDSLRKVHSDIDSFDISVGKDGRCNDGIGYVEKAFCRFASQRLKAFQYSIFDENEHQGF